MTETSPPPATTELALPTPDWSLPQAAAGERRMRDIPGWTSLVMQLARLRPDLAPMHFEHLAAAPLVREGVAWTAEMLADLLRPLVPPAPEEAPSNALALRPAPPPSSAPQRPVSSLPPAPCDQCGVVTDLLWRSGVGDGPRCPACVSTTGNAALDEKIAAAFDAVMRRNRHFSLGDRDRALPIYLAAARITGRAPPACQELALQFLDATHALRIAREPITTMRIHAHVALAQAARMAAIHHPARASTASRAHAATSHRTLSASGVSR
ncbi:MAG: hypothetical protein JNK72_24805 [Myxococcales bacterium]|nr:hypothetical protein [Myxococcales bacterium]